MNPQFRSQLLAAVTGGLVVAGTFLALGITGRRTTRTIVEEAPISASPASVGSSALTPHSIYVRDAPGVVFVKALIVQQVEDPFDLFPQREQSTSTGSGFLIDQRGFLLTNDHVVEGADRNTGVVVAFEDNVVRRAAVIAVDQNDDLALLKVSMAGISSVHPLDLGDSTTVRVGDPTLAIGNPFGLDRTLTSGIVSALQRQIQAPNGFSIDNVIQTDAPINPGNSGGPLLDATGRVIGINSQIETAGGDGGNGSIGIGFAVPINTAKEFLPRLERGGGAVRVAYLGATGVSTGAGVALHTVETGGPAANAGLRPGDVVTAVAGQHVASMAAIERIVDAQAPGNRLIVTVSRHGRPMHIPVALGSRMTDPLG
jgi:S1-C subfamily serine protease